MDMATLCNLRCPMCPVWGSGKKRALSKLKGVMSFEMAQKVLTEIAPVTPMLQPNMYGEPLLVPYLREILSVIKGLGITVAMNTNGLALTKELAEFFVEIRLDSIFFSIDAASPETLKMVRGIDKLDRIEAAVMEMMRVRGDGDVPRIGVSFTEGESNSAERNVFVHKWTQIVDCVRVGLLFEAGRFKNMLTPEKRKPCPALYNTMPIHHDGSVTICCLDGFKTTNMGNVFTDGGVKAVWNSDAFKEVRYYHENGKWDKIPICKKCNGWAQYELKEEVRDGLLIRTSPQYSYFNSIAKLKNWHGALLGGHPAPALK